MRLYIRMCNCCNHSRVGGELAGGEVAGGEVAGEVVGEVVGVDVLVLGQTPMVG